MKIIIIENKSGEHSFVVREGGWTGLYDADLLLSEFLDEAAHALSEDDYALPKDYIEKLLSTDAQGFCHYLNKWANNFSGGWGFSCVRAPGMLFLDTRETATVLAALRFYQQHFDKRIYGGCDIAIIANHGGSVEALDDEEIDALCDKLN